MNDYTYLQKIPSITRSLNKYFCGLLVLPLLTLITTVTEASMNEAGGSKKNGKPSVDPVNLSNDNLFFPRTVIHIPALIPKHLPDGLEVLQQEALAYS